MRDWNNNPEVCRYCRTYLGVPREWRVAASLKSKAHMQPFGLDSWGTGNTNTTRRVHSRTLARRRYATTRSPRSAQALPKDFVLYCICLEMACVAPMYLWRRIPSTRDHCLRFVWTDWYAGKGALQPSFGR